MDAKSWKDRIIQQMEACGLYKDSFESSVDALAAILEERDKVKFEYDSTGGQPTVLYHSDRGAENEKINPLLKIWMDLNKQALDYWSSLGLTSRSYKQLTGSMAVQVESDGLEKMLSEVLK